MSRSALTKSLAATAVIGLLLAQAATAQQKEQKLPEGSTTHFIYFPTGSYALTPEDQGNVREVAGMMQRTPAFVAMIIGKADSVGSKDFNDRLSQRRAEAVFEDLVYNNQVPESRVQLCWTGERVPFVSGADESAVSQNRVVAIVVRDTAWTHCGG